MHFKKSTPFCQEVVVIANVALIDSDSIGVDLFVKIGYAIYNAQ